MKHYVKILLGATSVLALTALDGPAEADSLFFTPVMNGQPVQFNVGSPVVGAGTVGGTGPSMSDAALLGPPAVASGGCAGTGANANKFSATSTPMSWQLTMGTGTCATTIVVNVPAAVSGGTSDGWFCQATNITHNSTLGVSQSAEVAPSSSLQAITLTSYSRTGSAASLIGVATAYTASDVILGGCTAH